MNSANAVKIICLLVLVILMRVSVSLEQEGLNCLKANPRVLHGVFDWYDKDIDPVDVTEADIKGMIHLFSTRFDRAYIIDGITSSSWLPVALSVAKFRVDTKSGVQLYLRINPGTDGNGRNETVQILKGYYDMVRTVHKVENGTIGGLILRTNLKTYTEDLEVYEEVFGPLDSFVGCNLGTLIEPEFLSKSQAEIAFFKKVKFFIVNLKVQVAETPEISADEIISLCDYLQANARIKNLSAEILCYTGYPVTGRNVNGVEGSLDGFQRFWCRIVETLKSEKGHARIIMRSAFDERLSTTSNGEGSSKSKYGWWRRKSLLSSSESDFEEKVESLHNVSSFKLSDNSECICSDSIYMVGVLVIVILQFFMIVYLVVISSRCSANHKKSSKHNSSLRSEDNRIFEMETPTN